MNLRWILNHLQASVRHHFFSYIAVLSVMSFLWMVGLGIYLSGKNADALLTLWGTSQEINFFLADNVSDEQKTKLAERIAADPRLQAVQTFDGRNLIQEMRGDKEPDSVAIYNQMIEDAELIALLPEGIQAQLNANFPAQDKVHLMKEIAAEWSQASGIVQASYGHDFTEQFRSLYQFSNLIFTVLLSFLVLVSIVLSYQLTHLAISSRKSEIEILEFIGATRRFIWSPFLIESLLLALAAFVVAGGLTYLGFQSVQGALAISPWTLEISKHISNLTLTEFFAIALMALAMSLLGAFLSLKKLQAKDTSLRRLARA